MVDKGNVLLDPAELVGRGGALGRLRLRLEERGFSPGRGALGGDHGLPAHGDKRKVNHSPAFRALGEVLLALSLRHI